MSKSKITNKAVEEMSVDELIQELRNSQGPGDLFVEIGPISNVGYILKPNLLLALETAIRSRSSEEANMGYTGDSALLAGWKSALLTLENGTLEIRP